MDITEMQSFLPSDALPELLTAASFSCCLLLVFLPSGLSSVTEKLALLGRNQVTDLANEKCFFALICSLCAFTGCSALLFICIICKCCTYQFLFPVLVLPVFFAVIVILCVYLFWRHLLILEFDNGIPTSLTVGLTWVDDIEKGFYL